MTTITTMRKSMKVKSMKGFFLGGGVNLITIRRLYAGCQKGVTAIFLKQFSV